VRRAIVIVVAAAAALAVAAPCVAAESATVAALQVALRSHGLYTGAVDGISGPMTRSALISFQRRNGIRATGKVGMATRCKLGKLGAPLLGQRQLSRGRVGWDVASLEFELRAFGLPAKRVDGRFDSATAAALRRFQRARGLTPDGVAGTKTFRALARGAHATTGTPTKARKRAATRSVVHVVRPGEGFAVIARRYHVGAAALARTNGLSLSSVIVPGQRLRVPGAVVRATPPRRRTGAPTVVHVVQAGEGFIAIARRYGVPAAKLAHANGLGLESVLTPGQRLKVPGRVVATRVTPPPATRLRHTVEAGESFFSIAQRYHVSPWRLARANALSLMSTIVPGQRLVLPRGARLSSSGTPVDRATVAAAIDRWSATYGVDTKLARAVAWMESGFQEDVVSSAGAIGVMQLLPETWEWVDTMLLGEVTPRTYDGNVRAGVRYLRWQLDQFDGDVRLALAGYYQGARAVRERGLFDDTKQYVSVILQLYGAV
jgi:peptidoglycan hydrolase-like protein with peptidoglycan-binding domain/murein DD-endopeptidase MepM/ murein hydrolase activator NlpD